MASATPSLLLDLDDHELLRLHCNGDPDAFGELFRRHKDRMWAVALRTTRDPELAADCVQDGFVAAFRRADSFRGDSAVTTWLSCVWTSRKPSDGSRRGNERRSCSSTCMRFPWPRRR